MSETANERLKTARKAAGYKTPTEAARAMGIPPPTYLGHEGGFGGLSKSGRRYAQFFRVSLDWLLEGRGEMRGRKRIIKVDGLVVAGAFVEQIANPISRGAPTDVELPTDGDIGALMVRGNSEWPRFLDGEFILYDRTPLDPADLVGQYAVVYTIDDRQLVKIIGAHVRGDIWRLNAHNMPEEDVRLVHACRYLGTLPKIPKA